MGETLATVPCPLSTEDQLSICITPLTSTGEVSCLQVPGSVHQGWYFKTLPKTRTLDFQIQGIFSIPQGVPEIC